MALPYPKAELKHSLIAACPTFQLSPAGAGALILVLQAKQGRRECVKTRMNDLCDFFGPSYAWCGGVAMRSPVWERDPLLTLKIGTEQNRGCVNVAWHLVDYLL